MERKLAWNQVYTKVSQFLFHDRCKLAISITNYKNRSINTEKWP